MCVFMTIIDLAATVLTRAHALWHYVQQHKVLMQCAL